MAVAVEWGSREHDSACTVPYRQRWSHILRERASTHSSFVICTVVRLPYSALTLLIAHCAIDRPFIYCSARTLLVHCSYMLSHFQSQYGRDSKAD